MFLLYISEFILEYVKSREFFVYIQVRNFSHDLEMFKTMFINILWYQKL